MRLWKDNTGPCMQVVHFSFAFGAFVAPIIAKYFISEDEDEMDNSTTASTATNSSTSTDGDSQSNFKFAYWITSVIFLPTLIAFVYFAVKLEFLGYKKKAKLPATQTSKRCNDKEIEFEMDRLPAKSEAVAGTTGDCSTEKENTSQKEQDFVSTRRTESQTIRYKFIILLLVSTFMFVYVGLEVCFGSLIFTVVVTGALDFSKHQGALIQSLFWGTFAFGRVFSILLVFCKVRSSVMMSMNLLGSFVAAAIMVVFTHNVTAIWLGSAALGCSYSSIYPTAMTWMSENVKATGIATSFLVIGGVLGDITLPAALGALVANVSPDSLFYLTFVGMVVSGMIVVSMFWTAHLKRKEQKDGLRVSAVSFRDEAMKLMDENSDEETLFVK